MSTVSSQHVKKPAGRRTAAIAGMCLLAAAGAGALLCRNEIRAQYLLATRFERLTTNAQGYREYRHIETGIVFVRLPGGTFWMGSTEEEARAVVEEMVSPSTPEDIGLDYKASDEMPRHAVTPSPFLIAKFEVTQSEWTRVVGSNWSQHRGPTHPVETVSWEDAREFCRKAGLSLPTEAQWEYACRAGTSGMFAGTMEEMGWPRDDSGHHPVGGRRLNGFGLHDMHGNVAEWVEDVFDFCFYSRPEATMRDPVCTTSCEFGSAALPPRGRRGWDRSAARGWAWQNHAYAFLGFRPAFNLR